MEVLAACARQISHLLHAQCLCSGQPCSRIVKVLVDHIDGCCLFSCGHVVSLKATSNAVLTCCVDLKYKYRLDGSICGAAKRRRTSAAGSFHDSVQDSQHLSVGTQPFSPGLSPLSSSPQRNPASSTNHPAKYAILKLGFRC